MLTSRQAGPGGGEIYAYVGTAVKPLEYQV